MKQKLFLLAAVVLAGLLFVPAPASAATPRDCDSNAVIYCGAYTKQELLDKLRTGDSRHTGAELREIVYGGNWGITEASLRSDQTVDGVVTKDGRVIVGGQVVATDARSAGRENIGRSTREGEVYVRPTSTSFRSAQIPAFVHLENGQFRYAVIKSCGNPVRATPVAKAVPQTAPPLPEAGGAWMGLAGLGTLALSGITWARSRRDLSRACRRG